MNLERNGSNFSKPYDHSSDRYNFILNVFQLGQDHNHRLKALRLAGLKRGDTVLDLCCGSGLSTLAIQKIIGPEGKIIAVDASSQMLDLAKKYAEKNNWTNIRFIHSGIETLEISEKIDFALFAFCFYDQALTEAWVKNTKRFLKPESGKLCFIDHKTPDNWLRYLATPLILLEGRLLGESYGAEELNWKPKEAIGTMLKDPQYFSYYVDCIFTIFGAPK
jgi:ubiquinone/menaquinone biosynthesis C-methylase UbiE